MLTVARVGARLRLVLIVVAYWHKHPNAKGHMLIVEDLYRALRHQEDLPLFEGNGAQ